MAISTVDTVQVIYELLTASGTELYSLVGTRVYSPVAPMPSVWNNSNAAVIFRETNSTPPASKAVEYIDVQFRCYGGSQSYTDARTVFRALRDRLDNVSGVTTTTGRVSRAFMVSARQEPLEPDTGWPCCVANYRIILN